MTTVAAKPFPPGIHAPCLTWFGDDANQEIDWDQQTKHIEYIVSSGVHGGTSWLEITCGGRRGSRIAQENAKIPIWGDKQDFEKK